MIPFDQTIGDDEIKKSFFYFTRLIKFSARLLTIEAVSCTLKQQEASYSHKLNSHRPSLLNFHPYAGRFLKNALSLHLFSGSELIYWRSYLEEKCMEYAVIVYVKTCKVWYFTFQWRSVVLCFVLKWHCQRNIFPPVKSFDVSFFFFFLF